MKNTDIFLFLKMLDLGTISCQKKTYVQSYTIDELIIKYKKLKNVEFIKIDAEGAEYEILLKGIKTINKFRPIIYCEVTRKKKNLKFFKK